MADSAEPLLHTCHACGTLIDIGDQEPLALVHCPSCGTGQRVRSRFDHFELQEVLGAGGMGAVYRALDTTLNRSVAFKVLRKEYSANPEFVAQFEREASITASIHHPHVVKVYSCGNDHGMLYIAMELVDKGSLDDLMTLQGRVAEVQVLQVGIQIAEGLDAAFKRGLIHRDVKPGNILFADAQSAKIVDFGLATLQEQANRGPGEIWGTPYYVAPEKLDSPPIEDFRSDMYSLGATLFHAVAGRPPFEADTASMVALKHLKSQVVSLQSFAPDISSTTAFVINKALHKDPNQRYQSYAEFIQNLEYARAELMKQGGKPPAKRTRVVMEDEDQARAMSWLTFGIVALIVLCGIGAWVMRDRIFGKRGARLDPAAEQQKQARAVIEERFKDTHGFLLKGDYPLAAERFRELSERIDVSQPMQDWLTLHEGLALLLDGKEIDSQKPFGQLADRDLYGKDADERKMSQFFIDLGTKLDSVKPIPASVAKDYDKAGYESIALFLFALKNWHLGEFEESAKLLRQFQSATPASPYQWIADYKPLMAPYLDDTAVFRSVADLLKPDDEAGKKPEAISALRSARQKLKLSGKLRTKLAEAADKLEKNLAESEASEQKRMAEIESTEAPKMAEAAKKCSASIAQFRFSEAKITAEAIQVSSEKYKARKDLLVKRMEALAKFKAQLIADMAAGYAGPVARRSRTSVPPGTLRANDAQIELRTPYGNLPIPWADLTPESVIAIAKSYIKADLPQAQTAERQWNLGVFALAFGKADVGRELVTAAAQARSEYQEILPRLLEPEGL
jgi:hypothetical protein